MASAMPNPAKSVIHSRSPGTTNVDSGPAPTQRNRSRMPSSSQKDQKTPRRTSASRVGQEPSTVRHWVALMVLAFGAGPLGCSS